MIIAYFQISVMIESEYIFDQSLPDKKTVLEFYRK